MKKLFTNNSLAKLLFIHVIVAILSFGFTACSDNEGDDDDDNSLISGQLNDAPYKNEAVKYYILNNNTDIESIELTASGNYIVLYADNQESSSGTSFIAKKTGIFHTNATQVNSRSFNRELSRYGDFTKKEDNTYELTNFGSIKIISDSQLEITINNEGTIVSDVRKESAIAENTLNNRLNHTWKVSSATIQYIDANGKIIKTKHFTTPDELREETVQAVLVTNHGSFYQIEWDNSIADYGLWQWSDTNNQIFKYTWTDEGETTEDGGFVQVTFKDDTATFHESSTEYSDESGKITILSTITARAIN